MGRIMDLVEQWQREREKPAPGTLDGHEVREIVWQTDKMTIFRDADGQLWRHLPAWRGTWPVTVVERVKE